MNTRAFSLSLVIAAIAMFMVYSFMEGKEAQLIATFGKKQPVVVTSEDIQELEEIDIRKLKVVSVPKNFIMPGSFTRKEDLRYLIAKTPIKAGEQITMPRVTQAGARTGLSRQVSVGKRGIAIRVNPSQAVSGLIKPGDRVDVLAKIDYAGGKADLVKVKTVLQDVLILSTGLRVTNAIPAVSIRGQDNRTRIENLNEYTAYSSVTLEVDPFQAQKIVFLNALSATPFLVLRNNDDKKMQRISSTKLYDLMGEDAAEAKAFFAKQNQKGGGRGR